MGRDLGNARRETASSISDDDRRFVERVRGGTIAPEEWTHEAHLRLAFLQLRCHAFGDAVRRIRRAIRRVNKAHGVENGYHETLTLAWSRLVAAGLAALPADAGFAEFAASNPELLSSARILHHYSRGRLDSERARREFVLPDQAPLPALPSPIERSLNR